MFCTCDLCDCCDIVKKYFSLVIGLLHWSRNPGYTSSICLPESLEDGDAKSWFRRFDVCASANEWNAAKKLTQLPTLLRGRAWAIYESLGEDDNASYAALKKAILGRLNPDTDEDRLAACEHLTRRQFREGSESIDELARDLETLLDQSLPGLPAACRHS